MSEIEIPSSSQPTPICPDYCGLVSYLIKPFLESPDSLKVDCEVSPRTARVLVRLAFEGEDKGRVFGRGGRNIQAIRTVVQAIARVAGQTAHLEVFGGQPDREGGSEERRQTSPRSASSHRPPPKPRPR